MKSVCVIGLGLIGGSIVRDIKLKKLAETVYAYDKHAKSLDKAKAAGWIDFAIMNLMTSKILSLILL